MQPNWSGLPLWSTWDIAFGHLFTPPPSDWSLENPSPEFMWWGAERIGGIAGGIIGARIGGMYGRPAEGGYVGSQLGVWAVRGLKQLSERNISIDIPEINWYKGNDGSGGPAIRAAKKIEKVVKWIDKNVVGWHGRSGSKHHDVKSEPSGKSYIMPKYLQTPQVNEHLYREGMTAYSPKVYTRYGYVDYGG